MTRKEYLDNLMKSYRIVRTLSKSDHGEMLMLRHRELERDLVIRSMDRSVAIYSVLKSITHPNIVEVYDVLEFTDGMIVLEEALTGMTLDERLSTGLFSYRNASDAIAVLADALHVIHEAGFVHRDVKPENIFITDDNRLKLLDFDVSRVVLPTDDTIRLGTVGYAAPEQFIGASDARTDIYALGVLLNIMVTGRHPSETLPKSGKARRIVEKATSINPEKRFQTVLELKAAL